MNATTITQDIRQQLNKYLSTAYTELLAICRAKSSYRADTPKDKLKLLKKLIRCTTDEKFTTIDALNDLEILFNSDVPSCVIGIEMTTAAKAEFEWKIKQVNELTTNFEEILNND